MGTDNTHNIKLSVIVPSYNEASRIMTMAETLSVHLDRIVGKDKWQFVIVSNGCKDNTGQVIKTIVERWPLTLSSSLKKPNYGNALREGLKEAQGEWAFIINVDHWDPVFLSWAWQHRHMYDLFVGSKRGDPTLDGRPKFRKILTWGLNFILQGFFGLVVTDTHGQKVLHLEILKPVLDSCVMSCGQFDTEFILRSQRRGIKIAELPVPIRENRKQRNLMLKKIAQNFVDLIKLARVLKNVPATRGVHYHRFSRIDLEGK